MSYIEISNNCIAYTSETINDFFSNGSSNFTLIHHNIRSFNENYTEFSVLLDSFSEFIDVYVVF